MRAYAGQYTGNGGASQAITGLPFTPEVLLLKAGSDNTQDSWFRTKDMPNGFSINVRGDSSFGTNRIISLDTNGFTVGNQTSVNQSSYPYYFIAYADDGKNDFATIAFVGDNTDDKLVFTRFQPDYAFLKSEAPITGCRKFAGQISALANENSNAAMPNFQGSTSRNDLIGFFSDGMRVSNGSNSGGNLINQSGYTTYGYVLKNSAGVVSSGTYTGTGSATTITTGVNQIFIDLQRNGGQNPTIQYLGEQSGGLTHAWDSATSTGKIPSVTATGFNISASDPNVNTSGQQYWYMTVAAQTGVYRNTTGIATIKGVGSVTI